MAGAPRPGSGWPSCTRQLTPAKPAKAAAEEAFAGFPREFWDDGDARWLLKVNESAGEWYFNKELHQQILWWAQLPDLLQLAAPPGAAGHAGKEGKPAARPVHRSKTIEQRVEDACEQAEEAGFRVARRRKSRKAGET